MTYEEAELAECLAKTLGSEINAGRVSLRDQIAIAAMQGLLAADADWANRAETVAGAAYEQADAMLAAREPKTVPE